MLKNKLAALTLSIFLSLSMVACSSNTDNQDSSGQDSSKQVQSEELKVGETITINNGMEQTYLQG
ncbi:hypothetical protein [Metaclostridioides mangenotii]|uniref:hypothetical protein n=1 Tax=Metaclostridioides mangenotii TaxID=1540 RepID=UPI00047FE893|nr:hypothetical protein [Clostridioides mangenotii]